MRIESLRELTNDDARRLIVGFTSTQRFEVEKSETPNRTKLSLDLVDIDPPFEKRFNPSDQMLGWYRGVLADGLSFGAYDDGLIGLTIVQPQWNGVAMVWELHVDESHRRQGIGGKLLAAVEPAARAKGLRAVSIETQTSNVPAITFYRACGYEIGAIDLTFYTNDDVERGEVVVFMKKAL